MSQSATKRSEKSEAIEKLRTYLRPGDTIYTILRHVSRSGMQREISVLILCDEKTPDSEIPRLLAAPVDVTWLAARALGDRVGKNGGVVIGGCGMDMGWHIVHTLGLILYRGGFGCIGERCPSNDHSNGDRDYTPHECATGSSVDLCLCTAGEQTHWHAEGSYAFSLRWL